MSYRNVSAEEKKDMMLEEINNWLNCKLKSLSINTLDNVHHTVYTNIMGKLLYCMKEEEKKKKKKQELHFDGCFDEAISLCKQAPLRIIKFIRLKMKDAAKLLKLFPKMKIIHLLRDPRGIMNSRFQIGFASKKKIEYEANKHCTRVINDLHISKEILLKFPGRLKVVLYEDLAEKPLETSKDIFRFSGLPFNEVVKKFIKNQTNAEENAGHYGIKRKDSSSTASEWRTRMKFGVSNIVYQACLKSNKILGYLSFGSKQLLKNQTIASRNEVDVEKELLKSSL